ncbi:MAG: glycosyltransferase [Holosporales bacterium]|jgi:glycosyltransferase Alg8
MNELDLRLAIGISIVALWRYSWFTLHAVRAGLYAWLEYPALRRRANLYTKHPPIAVIVASYNIDPLITNAVVKALCDAAANYRGICSIAFTVANSTESTLIQKLFLRYKSENVKTFIHFQENRGKRVGLAETLAGLSRHHKTPPAMVALMDGDSIVPKNIFSHCIGHLMTSPNLGALTVNNVALNVSANPYWMAWMQLRYHQRHFWMQSQSFSEELLVLTGRFSCFRGAFAFEEGFIKALAEDALHHSHLGSIKMITGDDKSTWLYTVHRGLGMRYLPDIKILCAENEQRPFLEASPKKLIRWSGNMLRAGHKALFEPGRLSPFMTLMLIDQRISIFTGLYTPTLMFIILILGRTDIALYWILWISCSRMLFSLILGGRSFQLIWPLFLVYNQIIGNVLKGYVLTHLDVQGWSQNAQLQGRRRVAWLSHAWFALGALIIFYISLFTVIPSQRDSISRNYFINNEISTSTSQRNHSGDMYASPHTYRLGH